MAASNSGYEPLLSQTPTPVVVVSPQFCSPDVVPLTVRKKVMSITGGDFTITDPYGAAVMQVKGSVLSVRNRRVLLGAAGQPILSMHEKLRTEMDVFFAGNTAKQVCDFKMKGSYFDRNCAIYLGDSNIMIAKISRKYTASNVLLGKDTFSVTVFPDVDHVFVAALVVVLDQVHSRDRNY